MGRAEGAARARFWLIIVGCAILGMLVALVSEAAEPSGVHSGLTGILVTGAGIGAFIGFLFWLRRFSAR
jgi:hypothetical protein